MVDEIIKTEPIKEEVKEVIKEETPKKQRRISKLRLLPKPLLKEINDAIDKGAGATVLRTLIKERYKGDLKVDSNFIIRKYIEDYKTETKNKVKEEVITPEVLPSRVTEEDSLSKLTSKWDWSDKKNILQELGNWCKERVSNLREEEELSPGQESSLVKYFSEIRAIVETLSKLSGELDSGGDKQVIINLVTQETSTILNLVQAAIKEVYGEDKLIIFRETLKKKFDEVKAQNPKKEEIKEIEGATNE